MRRFTKSRPKTEVEEFNSINNLDTRTYMKESNTQGQIIFVETDDPVISAFMISKGFS